MEFALCLPEQDLRFTEKAAAVEEIFSLAKAKPVLLLASESFVRREGLQPLTACVCGNNGIWRQEIEPNPTTGFVADVLCDLEGKNFDAIIAMGGGSCIDLAKTIGALRPVMQQPTSAQVAIVIESMAYLRQTNAIPVYAIPTTAGTGSEVTHWATVWDVERGQKLSVDAPFLAPKAAWVSPEFTHSAPAGLTLATGLDALSHALESCLVKQANPISRLYAEKAVGEIAAVLPKLVGDLQNTALRERMSYASLLAGLAFAQTRTGAAHAMSYALTLRYNIPHGFAVAASLPGVLEYSAPLLPDVQVLLKPFREYGGFARWLQELCAPVQLLTLSAFGVPQGDIPALAKQACAAGRMQNSAYPFTVQEVEAIYQSAFI